MVHVHLRAFLQLLALEVVVDAVGRDRALADDGGQQVRAHDVAAHEVLGLVRHLVEFVGGDQALAVVEFLETLEVAALADGRDDQVGVDIAFRAGLGSRLALWSNRAS